MTLEQTPAVASALVLSMGAHLLMMVVLPRPSPASPSATRKVELELYSPAPTPRVDAPRPPSAVKVKRRAPRVEVRQPAAPAAAEPPTTAPIATAPQGALIVGSARRSTAPAGGFAVPQGPPSGVAAGGGGTGDSEPQLLDEVRIAYPDEARRAGVSGSVRLQVTIDASGQVTQVSVISGPGFGLDEAAREALRRFRFKPGTRQGAPVGSTFEYSYSFELD